MPRNDQIARQWHLLRRLEGSNGLTLHELVEAVPEDFPKNARTVRRDLDALESAGFPLVNERRDGQTRWRLMEGFREIPALGFSATELMALLLSRNLLRPLEGTEISESLNAALGKASADRCGGLPRRKLRGPIEASNHTRYKSSSKRFPQRKLRGPIEAKRARRNSMAVCEVASLPVTVIAGNTLRCDMFRPGQC